MADRIRIGVVGCGLIAQVMHLPHLDERFELAAVCDVSPSVAEACARRFGAGRAVTRWEDLLDADLDAVLVLISGSHAPIAVACARAGLHVFVEKPMCLSVAEGTEMIAAAQDAGVRLMVGTMKRYDPAYERLATLTPALDDLRLVRVTTLESPLGPYVAHYPIVRADDVAPETIHALRADDDARLHAALPDVDDETRWVYRWILLDSLVHELNALRGVLGEPTALRFADLSRRCVAVNLVFGDVECHLSWVDLPDIARYSQEFAFYAPDRRVTLLLPSPFLRSAPSELIVEEGDAGTPHASRSVEVTSYEEAFKRELVEFSECIRGGREPRTPGIDGLHDVALCATIARAYATRAPVAAPSAVAPAPRQEAASA
jgi:predicted dehydrogenase